MSLSDCEKCWDTPCGCGWYFRDWDEHSIASHVASCIAYRDDAAKRRILLKAIEIIDSALASKPTGET